MGSVGNKSDSLSETIRNEFIQSALNSRLKGVRRDAENGTGNYDFKNARSVSFSDAMKMQSIKFMERDGKTLASGLIGDNKVFYADYTDSDSIKQLKERSEKATKGNLSEGQREIRTTSTYDRWKKQNDANFKAWFGKR